MKNEREVNFIKECRIRHGTKYDYSKVILKGLGAKILIGCPYHGLFSQIAFSHKRGVGCEKCARVSNGRKKALTTSKFKRLARKKHGRLYDYSLVNYTRNIDKVKIVCRKHGVFRQLPRTHLVGHGCVACGIGLLKSSKTSNRREFIRKSKIVHGNNYDYSKVIYEKSKKKVIIGCYKHGPFKVTPKSHIGDSSGCPICKLSKGELRVALYLKSLNIKFKQQYSIRDSRFRYDFFIPSLNLLIEYDGIQHSRPLKWFGGKKGYYNIVKRDYEKDVLAKDNGYLLFRIPHWEYKNTEKLLLTKLNSLCRYKRNGKCFSTFLNYCRENMVGGSETPDDHKRFKFKFNAL